MVLADEAFEKCLGHDGGAFMNRMSALEGETPKSSLPQEDTAKWWLSVSQEVGPHKALNP